MEDGDDDFGDLYADVEVEASSAMNVAPQISQLQFVSDETGKEDRVSDGDEEDDDDDDDLNIVLNSDDDSGRHGEGLPIARSNTNVRSGELEDEDDEKSHSLYKYSRSQSAAYGSELKGSGCGAAAYLSREDNVYCQRPMGPQHGQRFSLPWSRSIVDVNIDAFEQKPWKHPGADIADYFNFGLNEDSWKLYCNKVDVYRHRGPMPSGSPASEPAQLIEKKGRAIQVEDSIVERQSSMDVRHQLERDSDVIQITTVDPEENCCGSVKEGSGNHESSVPEASNHGDVSGDDDGTDHLSFSSASEDESFEGNQPETEISAHKRSSNRRSSSISVARGSKNHEIHQISDEAIRTSENTKERTGEDTCTTDPSIFPAESSEAEKSPQNHRKSFEDRWKSYSHERRSSTELTQSLKPGYHHSDDHRHHSRKLDDKRKHGDHRYRSRCNSPPVYNNRTRRDSRPELKSHHENDDMIYLRRQDEKRKHEEHRYHARRQCNPVYYRRTYERVHPFDPYNEESILHSKESKPPLDYYHGERFSCYEDNERFGPETGRPVFRSLEEEEYYDEHRRYTDEFRWQNKRKGNYVLFGNKGINDEFFLEREYSDDIESENLRYFAYNDREKDEYEDEYVKHVENTRWEFRGPVKNKILNNPFPEREESHTNNGRWHGKIYERQRRYEGQLTERFGYDESLGGYYEPFDREEDYKIDYDDRLDVARSGDHLWQSEMQWKDDDIMIPFEESVDDPYVKGRQGNFERISNVKYEGSPEKRFRGSRDSDITRGGSYEWVFKGGVDSFDPHMVDGCDHVDELIDGGYKRKREVISGKKFRKSYRESGKKLSPSCRNSMDSRLVVREGKDQTKKNIIGCTAFGVHWTRLMSTRQKLQFFCPTPKGGTKMGKRLSLNLYSLQKDSSKNLNKAAEVIKTKALHECLDIEEGQILTEKVNTGPTIDDTVAHVNDGNGFRNQKGKMELDKSQILEARAKMEKRRARFNSATKMDPDSTTMKVMVVDSNQETGSNKPQRPARKRRWGGS